MNTPLKSLLLSIACLATAAPALAIGEPENKPAQVNVVGDSVKIVYDHSTIFAARLPKGAKVTTNNGGHGDQVEQRITITLPQTTAFSAQAYGSNQSMAAETRGTAQQRFPMVRTAHGMSTNLRNNAVYERMRDWMLEMPEGTVITPAPQADGSYTYDISADQQQIDLVFRPLYYQKFKRLDYYKPWTYEVYKESITGWSSWWAYFSKFKEQDMDQILKVWDKQRLSDYGFRFMQIDDAYQGEHDADRDNCNKGSYRGGRPTTWLDWRKDRFPSGLDHYVSSVKHAGFTPAIWMGCFFTDNLTAEQHPDWFMTDTQGKPVVSPWVGYVMDATNEEVRENLIRPTFRGLKKAGVEYVKIDQLRHYLFDGLNNHPEWAAKKGVKTSDVIRTYLSTAREELGRNTFMLSCWGVLPEGVGIVDACRIGGDGYGPKTLQQYNSWNGIVWRNDPDHCDIKPVKRGVDVGNVKELSEVQSSSAESIIRPALASIAGAMLLLSDKPEVYEDSLNLVGIKKVSPVVFSVPGQLYDFDAVKTDWLKTHPTSDIKNGTDPSPIDADQFGDICPWWLNEYSTGFDSWNVLHRLNWEVKEAKTLPAMKVSFADLGLSSEKEYHVYEFWTNRYLGIFKGGFEAPELANNGISSFAIRENAGRPQLLSTSRHLSQGAVDIEKLVWTGTSLEGRSHMIGGDAYTMTITMPKGYKLKSATLMSGEKLTTEMQGNLLLVKHTPKKTTSEEWTLEFTK